jgi:hypothetical protein
MLTFACASAAFALFRGQNSTSSSSSNRCRFTRRREATKNSGAKHPASSNQPQKSSKFAKPCSWNFLRLLRLFAAKRCVSFCYFAAKDICPFVTCWRVAGPATETGGEPPPLHVRRAEGSRSKLYLYLVLESLSFHTKARSHEEFGCQASSIQ